MNIFSHIHDPAVHDLVAPDARFEALATGFDFLEGPLWDPRDQSLVFSDIMGNSIYRWTAVDGVSTLRRNSYMANGNAFDAHGRVVTCEHATSALSRTDFASGGEREVLASHYDGRQLNSPNDVVVRSDGAIYFTDPTSGRSAGFGVPREPELPFSGVYRFGPSGALTLLVDDFAKPNGLCFSHDERQLFINDTVRQHIRVFDVSEDGRSLSNGRLFATLDGNAPGVADGMKVDAEGNLYCCGPGGIHIFAGDGRPLAVLSPPEYTANFCFGGADLKTLYITATTTLYCLPLRKPGHPLFQG